MAAIGSECQNENSLTRPPTLRTEDYMYDLHFHHPDGPITPASAAVIATDYFKFVEAHRKNIEEAPAFRYMFGEDEFLITAAEYSNDADSMPDLALCLIEIGAELEDSRMLCTATYAEDGVDLRMDGLIAPETIKETSREILATFLSQSKSRMSDFSYGGQRAN